MPRPEIIDNIADAASDQIAGDLSLARPPSHGSYDDSSAAGQDGVFPSLRSGKQCRRMEELCTPDILHMGDAGRDRAAEIGRSVFYAGGG
jgi:hypothetical protein